MGSSFEVCHCGFLRGMSWKMSWGLSREMTAGDSLVDRLWGMSSGVS